MSTDANNSDIEGENKKNSLTLLKKYIIKIAGIKEGKLLQCQILE